MASVCQRWIYSTCLNCALDAKEREASEFHYQYSVYQLEYSRNLIFKRTAAMMQVMEALVDRNGVWMNVTNLKTILGRKNRPQVRSRKKSKSRSRDPAMI